jgi:ParB family chromosome partitioning protein
MKLEELPVESIGASDWNPNEASDEIMDRLHRSIEQFGFLVPLVVRPIGDGYYETVGGAHRLRVLQDMGESSASCVVVDVDDVEARLLSQCLNRLQGEDNLGLRAELIRRVLEEKSLTDVVSLLPDTAETLQALSNLRQNDLAASLQRWQSEQEARLRHLTFQLVPSELEVVEEALERARSGVGTHHMPNKRGRALYEICKDYLKVTESQ